MNTSSCHHAKIYGKTVFNDKNIYMTKNTNTNQFFNNLFLFRMLCWNVNKLYLIFVQGIFWCHEILKHIQFAGCWTLQHAMNARVNICISHLKGVKCGRWNPFSNETSCLNGLILMTHVRYLMCIFVAFENKAQYFNNLYGEILQCGLCIIQCL